MISKSEIVNLIRNSDPSEIKYIIEQLEKNGILSDCNLSYTRIVFDQAGTELLEYIKLQGFSGALSFIGSYIKYVGNVYAIYDANRFDLEMARDWLFQESLATQQMNINSLSSTETEGES
jgi:hypothetical protein